MMPSVVSAKPTPRAVLSVAVIAVVIGAFLRCACLGRGGLYTDELPTYWMASAPSLGELAQRSWSHAGMLPPFFVIERLSLAVFGPSELTLRAPAALFGVLSIVVMGLLGRELFGTSAGAFAALLLAVDRFAIRQAQSARPYTMAVLLMLLSLWLFVRLFEGTGGPATRFVWALATIAMVYTHGLFLPIVALEVLIWIGWRAATESDTRTPIGASTFALVGVACAIPVWHLARLVARRDELIWLPPATLDDWARFIVRPNLAVGLLLVVVLGLTTAAGEVPKLPRRRLALLLGSVLVPTLAAVAASRLGGLHLFEDRYLSPYAIPLYLLLGWCASVSARQRPYVASCLILLATTAAPLARATWGGCPYPFGDDASGNAVRAVTSPQLAVDTVIWATRLVEGNAAHNLTEPSMRGYLTAPLGSFYASREPRCVVVGPYSLHMLRQSHDILRGELSRCDSTGRRVGVVCGADELVEYERVLEWSHLLVSQQDVGGAIVAVFAPRAPVATGSPP